jgi:hypothetical protein
MKKILFSLLLIPIYSLAQYDTFQAEVQSEQNENIAVIKVIVDASALFNSNESPNIMAGNNSLSLVAIKSMGGGKSKIYQGEEIKNKDNYSDVFWGNKVTWISFVSGPQSSEYNIRLLQIELPPNNCAFDKVHYPGQSGIINAWVKDQPKEPIECSTWYAIWFELENKEGDTRVFRLDPWMIVK